MFGLIQFFTSNSIFAIWSSLSHLFSILTYSISYFNIQSFLLIFIWILNWQFTYLPLTFVLIPGFTYFIFSIISYQKNIHLLLLYLKHAIKLSWYNLGCYSDSQELTLLVLRQILVVRRTSQYIVYGGSGF